MAFEDTLTDPDLVISLLTYLVVSSVATFALIKVLQVSDAKTGTEDQSEKEQLLPQKIIEPVEMLGWGVGIGVISFGMLLTFQLVGVGKMSHYGHQVAFGLYFIGLVCLMMVCIGFSVVMVHVGKTMTQIRMENIKK